MWYSCHVLENGQWLKNTGQGESNQLLLQFSQWCSISNCSVFNQKLKFYVNFNTYLVKIINLFEKKMTKFVAFLSTFLGNLTLPILAKCKKTCAFLVINISLISVKTPLLYEINLIYNSVNLYCSNSGHTVENHTSQTFGSALIHTFLIIRPHISKVIQTFYS